MANWRTRLAAHQAYTQLQARPLLDALQPGEPISFTQLIMDSLLRVADHPQVVPTIVRHLEVDERPAVRWKGARVLGKLGDPRALPLLERLAREQRTPGGRAVFLKAITAIGGAEAGSALGRVLAAEKGTAARLQVLGHLKTLGSEAVETLMRQRSSRDSVIRAKVASILGEVGGSEATRILIEMTDDSHGRVRNHAVKGLSRAATPTAVAKLDELHATEWRPWRRRRLARLRHAAHVTAAGRPRGAAINEPAVS